MDKPNDFYAALGVGRDVSKKDLTKAYRALAKKYHPDRNPDDAAAQKRFREIQDAYDVLNDSEKKAFYDEYGINPLNSQELEAARQAKAAGLSGDAFRRGFAGGGPGGSGFRGEPSGGPGGFRFEGGDGAGFDFSQLFGGAGGPGGSAGSGGFDFSQLFGGMGGGSSGGRRGARGRRAAAPPIKGRDIEHSVTVPLRTAISGGTVTLRVARSENTSQTESIDVKIPAGIEDGKRIRLRGQGEQPGGNAVPGDLLLRIHVTPDPLFRREGNHLIVRVPVTFAEATLGGTIDVPSPNGTVSVRIPAGTSSGKRLRVRGHGAPSKSGSGDLLVEILVDVPRAVDPATESLIRELDTKCGLATTDARRRLRW